MMMRRVVARVRRTDAALTLVSRPVDCQGCKAPDRVECAAGSLCIDRFARAGVRGGLSCVQKPDESAPARPAAAVPLLEACPSCGTALEGQKCKAYCPNEGCALFRRIIENCAGD